MHDYYAILKVQQGRIRSLMQERGIKTANELSELSGVSPSDIGKYLNFRWSPRLQNGTWRHSVIKLCKFFAVEPSDVFPDYLDHEVATNRIEMFSDARQLSGMAAPQLTPYEEVAKDELVERVNGVLSALTPMETAVVRSIFFDGQTLEQTGKRYGKTREAVRVVKARALHKLRHPSRIRQMEGLIE